nr:hypothetical protein [Labrenzia sp. VG12]
MSPHIQIMAAETELGKQVSYDFEALFVLCAPDAANFRVNAGPLPNGDIVKRKVNLVDNIGNKRQLLGRTQSGCLLKGPLRLVIQLDPVVQQTVPEISQVTEMIVKPALCNVEAGGKPLNSNGINTTLLKQLKSGFQPLLLANSAEVFDLRH